MKVILLGAAGFIGTNLAIKLSESTCDEITLVDEREEYFDTIKKIKLERINYKLASFDLETNFDLILEGQEIVYHLVSSTIPSTSNQKIPEELMYNVVVTSRMLEACVRCGVKKVVFISSGGTVYGKGEQCPLAEDAPTYPINSYGIQKITIEKLLYLYNYMYGLDYRVVRLANPYGPYQRPNGILGAVTTFTHKILRGEDVEVYGDGSVVRDFIYIDDAVNGIIKIAYGECDYKTFNLGSGVGVSISKLLEIIQKTLNKTVKVTYVEGRKVDVPINYLDVSLYEKTYGKASTILLEEGIKRTAIFLEKNHRI